MPCNFICAIRQAYEESFGRDILLQTWNISPRYEAKFIVVRI
jgi:hypothetical protein